MPSFAGDRALPADAAAGCLGCEDALAAAKHGAAIGVLILAWATLGVQLYQGAYDVEDVDDRGNFDNAFDARWP